MHKVGQKSLAYNIPNNENHANSIFSNEANKNIEDQSNAHEDPIAQEKNGKNGKNNRINLIFRIEEKKKQFAKKSAEFDVGE